jgi:hypothetical protein
MNLAEHPLVHAPRLARYATHHECEQGRCVHATTGCPAGNCSARQMRECYEAADHMNKNLMERLRNG